MRSGSEAVAQNKRNLAFWIATWFGSGLSPKAPGTAGSLAAVPFAWLIYSLGGEPALLLAAAAAFFIGWWATKEYCGQTGREDPGEVVIDEVAALWLLLALAHFTWTWWLFFFVIFRLFDAIKPWPISLADRKVKGAFGVMLDDLLAVLYPLLLLSAAGWISLLTGHDLWIYTVNSFMGTPLAP